MRRLRFALPLPEMAEASDDPQTEASNPLSTFEKKCVDDFDKDPLTNDSTLGGENERLNDRAWTNFQNTASAVSNLYRASSQTANSSLWPLFQTAANNTTTLYKDSLELIRNSFELGSRYGDYRRKKEILSWARKKRRSIPREEVLGFLCGKPVPASWHRAQLPYGRYAGNRQELNSQWLTREGVNDVNFQLFKDANYQGRRSSQPGNFSISPARGLDDFHGCLTRDKKRLHSDCRTGSPSHKRAKICVMETDEF